MILICGKANLLIAFLESILGGIVWENPKNVNYVFAETQN